MAGRRCQWVLLWFAVVVDGTNNTVCYSDLCEVDAQIFKDFRNYTTLSVSEDASVGASGAGPVDIVTGVLGAVSTVRGMDVTSLSWGSQCPFVALVPLTFETCEGCCGVFCDWSACGGCYGVRASVLSIARNGSSASISVGAACYDERATHAPSGVGPSEMRSALTLEGLALDDATANEPVLVAAIAALAGVETSAVSIVAISSVVVTDAVLVDLAIVVASEALARSTLTRLEALKTADVDAALRTSGADAGVALAFADAQTTQLEVWLSVGTEAPTPAGLPVSSAALAAALSTRFAVIGVAAAAVLTMGSRSLELSDDDDDDYESDQCACSRLGSDDDAGRVSLVLFHASAVEARLSADNTSVACFHVKSGEPIACLTGGDADCSQVEYWPSGCVMGRPLPDGRTARTRWTTAAEARDEDASGDSHLLDDDDDDDSGAEEHAGGAWFWDPEAWARRAEMEHASVASFALHTLSLVAAGAPLELLGAAAAAQADEVRHCAAAYSLAERFRADRAKAAPSPLKQPASPAGFSSSSEDEEDALATLVAETWAAGAVAETHAAAQAVDDLQRFATVAAPRDASREAAAAVLVTLQEVERDERRHAAIAWRELSWACGRGGVSALAAARADEKPAATEVDAALIRPAADYLVAKHGNSSSESSAAPFATTLLQLAADPTSNLAPLAAAIAAALEL